MLDLKTLLKTETERAKQDLSKKSLFLCILGSSGAGKSHVCGTLGVKTLFLYFSTEKHGFEVSKKEGGENVIGVCVDRDGDTPLSPDETLAKLRFLLKADLKSEGFKAVVIDSLTDLDECIGNSNELKSQCLTATGKLDSFKTTPVTKKIMRSITKDLLELQAKTGIHVITTCVLEIKAFDEDGSIAECSPRLNTYSLAEDTLQAYGDRLVISSVTKGDGTKARIFDFGVSISKSSKDQTGRIKKIFAIEPRLLTGVLPEKGFCKADLKEILKLRGI